MEAAKSGRQPQALVKCKITRDVKPLNCGESGVKALLVSTWASIAGLLLAFAYEMEVSTDHGCTACCNCCAGQQHQTNACRGRAVFEHASQDTS